MGMAWSPSAALTIALALTVLVESLDAAQYVVGDSAGWVLPTANANVNYSAWALKNNYHPGDTLLFNYPQDSHSVLEVNRADFTSCVKNNAINHHSDGKTSIRLSRPGPHWFICGVPGHCEQGQRFGIMVTPSSPGSGASSGVAAKAPAPSESTISPVASQVPNAQGGQSGHAPAPAPANSASGLFFDGLHGVFLVIVAALCASVLL